MDFNFCPNIGSLAPCTGQQVSQCQISADWLYWAAASVKVKQGGADMKLQYVCVKLPVRLC